MSRLTDMGVEGSEQVLLNIGESPDAREDDRSLATVMREIARSLAGWLFFVVAVQLLLHGARFI